MNESYTYRVYTTISLEGSIFSTPRMSWLSFSITVERSGFPSSDFWSMLVGAQDVTGFSESAVGLYPFAFLFLAILQVTERGGN